MARFMSIWDDHLADPHKPQTLAKKLGTAGFKAVKAEPVVHLETVLGWKKLGLERRLGTRLVTYADDLVILCRRATPKRRCATCARS
jgi:hypothetical protein